MAEAWESEERDDRGRWEGGGSGGSADFTPGGVAGSGATWSETATPVGQQFSSEDEANAFLEDRGEEGTAGQAQFEAQEASRQDAMHALGIYTGSGAQNINEGLRGEATLNEAYQPSVTELDRAISMQEPTSSESTLYRGLYGEGIPRYSEMQPGDRFTEPSFTSTSTSEEAANRFASRGSWVEPSEVATSQQSGQTQLLQVEAPAGTRGISVNGVSAIGRAGGGGTSESEQEVILPRMSTFEVVSQEADRTVVRIVGQ